MRCRAVVVSVALIGCRLGFDPIVGDGPVADTADNDATLGPWSTPMPVGPVATSAHEEDCTGSVSKNEIVFAIRPAFDLYTVTRADETMPWGVPEPFPHNTGATEGGPRLELDERTMYFASKAGGGVGEADIWTTTRTAPGQPWGVPQNLAEVNTAEFEKWLTPCNGGRYILVRDADAALGDLYEGVLGGAPPVAISALNTTAAESTPWLSPDCLVLYYATNASGTFKIHVTRRAAIGAAWDPPVPFALNAPTGNDEDPWLSPDGRMVVFASDRGGTYDVYIATRE